MSTKEPSIKLDTWQWPVEASLPARGVVPMMVLGQASITSKGQ